MDGNVLVCKDRLLVNCLCSSGTLMRNDTHVYCTTTPTYRCERESILFLCRVAF